MVKVLHKVFKAAVKEFPISFPNLGESGPEVTNFIKEPRNFPEVTRLLADVKKDCLKENLKEIKNITKNQTFLTDNPEEVDPVTPFIYVYRKNPI